MSRIKWSYRESEAVALQAAVDLRRQGIREFPEAGNEQVRDVLDAIRHAQQVVLPQDRRRLFTAGRASFTANFIERLNALLIAAEPTSTMEQRVPKLIPRPEAEAPVPAVPPPPPPVCPPVEEPKLAEPTGLDFQKLANVPLKDLLQAVLHRVSEGQSLIALKNMVDIVNQLEKKVAGLQDLTASLTSYDELMTTEMDSVRKEHADVLNRVRDVEQTVKNVEEQTSNNTLPIVAICGCLKSEFDQVCEQTRGLPVKLKFYAQDEKPKRIFAQWAILMRFTAHAWQEQINASIPRGQFTHVRGGIGQVVNQLEVWFKS